MTKETEFKVGTRVRFTDDWEIFPHDRVAKGETGVVAVNDDEMISVKLDTIYEGLEYWGNEVHFYKSEEERNVGDYLKKI